MDGFLYKLVGLYELLNKRVSVEETLEHLYKTFKDYIPYDRISIALLDNEGNIFSHDLLSHYEPTLKKGFSMKLENTSLKNIISSKQPRVINNYVEYMYENLNSESTKLMLNEGIMASLACPLITNDLCFGILLFSSKTINIYKDEHVYFAKMISNNIAITIEKNLLVDDLILTSITGFARLVEAKDSDTGVHLDRMQNYSKIIAIELQKTEGYSELISNSFIDDIIRFSPLHDIGKVGIADGILLKPAKLTPEEFEVMKKHTIIGSEVLKKASNNLLRNGKNFFEVGIEIALCHHEKYNGQGYPFGLSGDDIPLSARIVMVADVFDALTSKRVYKSAIAVEDAIEIIIDESGKSFDPNVVQALLDSKARILEVYQKYHETVDFDRR
ncbi:MAG: hypothetical protein CVU84_10895 [Firmicutes bacterium HGW-Firmicutes-1]|jgi:HD-GYP domain-containing protein (c-di-GMP phosphodiesterase class II)|nr:MAG: hypothetical protein CVU84_10895 [Firmicutes bacterium HGW-Firmicutes-1]